MHILFILKMHSFIPNGVYRSSNNGDSWETLTSGLPLSGYGRIEIAIAPSNDDVIYVIFEDTTISNSGGCLGIYRSTDGGNKFKGIDCPPIFPGMRKQACYDLILGVDPNNENRIWAGGVKVSVSNDGGNSWKEFNGGHDDYHNLTFGNNNSAEVLIGNDGGVYKSYNADALIPSVTDKNNSYNVTQFYTVALHPDVNSNYMLGGTQDNGTQRFRRSGLNSTNDITGGDGAFCFIDQDNPDIQITGTQNRRFLLSTDGGPQEVIPALERGKALFITPADYDDANNVFYCSDILGTYSRINDVGNRNEITNVVVENLRTSRLFVDEPRKRASAIKVSPNIENRVYFGTEDGRVIMVDSANTGTSKTGVILLDNSSKCVSSIAIEKGNEDHILVTYSNYGLSRENIFETENGGETWQRVGDNLPDMPVRWVEFNPFNSDQAIIATELGVWSTTNLNKSDTKWYPTNNFGLANVRVDMLAFRSSDYLLAAATHGRGVFTTDYFSLFGNCPPEQVLSGEIFSDLYVAEDLIESDGTIPSKEKVIFQAGNDILLIDGFTVEPDGDFWGIINSCSRNDDFRSAMDTEIRSTLVKSNEHINFSFFPNPAKDIVNLEYHVPKDAEVDITIGNIKGELVQQVVNNFSKKGETSIQFDVSSLSKGLYFVVMQAGREKITEKLIILD